MTLARRFKRRECDCRQMASRQRRLNLVQAWLTPREFWRLVYRALKRTAKFIAAATRQLSGVWPIWQSSTDAGGVKDCSQGLSLRNPWCSDRGSASRRDARNDLVKPVVFSRIPPGCNSSMESIQGFRRLNPWLRSSHRSAVIALLRSANSCRYAAAGWNAGQRPAFPGCTLASTSALLHNPST